MIGSSTIGSWIRQTSIKKKKVYPEKLCKFCSSSFVPKNAQASRHRYCCYDWKCENVLERERAKQCRERDRDRKRKKQGSSRRGVIRDGVQP